MPPLELLIARYIDHFQKKKVRRIMHEQLNVNAARAFQPYQALENQQMMYDILNDPDNYVSHVRRYSNSLMTTTTFG